MPKIKINGAEIFYEDHGPHDAPAIVFSPVLFLDSSMYQPMVDAFADEYRVITYDHRGQGQSERPSKKSDLQTSIKDAISLIEFLKVNPCHFIGNCLGAYVALGIAVQRSDLLKSCTLMGAVSGATPPKELKELDHYLDMIKKEGAKNNMQAFISMMFGPSFLASIDPYIADRREKMIAHLQSLSSDELENARQVFHHPTISKENLEKISVPVLIIAGDEDQPGHTAAYKQLGQWIPHVNYKTVHHAGYAVAIEQPQDVINLVRDHLEKSERNFSVQVSQNKSKHKGSRARV